MKNSRLFPDRSHPDKTGKERPVGHEQDPQHRQRSKRRQIIEESMQVIMGPMEIRATQNVPDFDWHYNRAMSALRIIGRGYLALVGVRHPEDQVDEAVSLWNYNMLRSGYRMYLTQHAERPFFPYASKAMWNIGLTMAGRQRDYVPLLDDGMTDRRENPLQLAMRTESKEILLDAIEALPTNVKQYICLRFLDEKWPREIADLLGGTPGSVSSKILRGLARLHDDVKHGRRDLWPVD